MIGASRDCLALSSLDPAAAPAAADNNSEGSPCVKW